MLTLSPALQPCRILAPMADAAEDKSRGLKFAERQLLRHGWQQGKGLGKRENGISEAIKVKVKCDKTGVGHSPGEEFTFHWWDHVFNKAAAGLSVESSEDGVTVQKLLEDEGPVSNKKPRKAELSKAKLYGRFIKSATLLSGEEQPEEKPGSSADSSDSEDEDQRLDLSSTTKLSDDDLIKVCGGRTAHKGARHGVKMSAKLARLEQQEREFLEKYGKKSQPGCSDASPASRGRQQQQQEEEEDEEGEGRTGKRKKKKKKQQQRLEEREALMEEGGHCSETGASGQQDLPRKKKKKGKRGRSEAVLEQEQGNSAGEEEEGRKKRKSNKKCRQEPEEEQAEDTERSRRKKKKKKKAQDE
ncbi:GPTC4 protein, partial [Atractosteus spatula]|nr:GPTC4 protein [Atractosteus spatula]